MKFKLTWGAKETCVFFNLKYLYFRVCRILPTNLDTIPAVLTNFQSIYICFCAILMRDLRDLRRSFYFQVWKCETWKAEVCLYLYSYQFRKPLYSFWKKCKNEYDLTTRYESLNSITFTWKNAFHIRLYAICSAKF